MPSLRELQTRLLGAILDGEPLRAEPLIAPGGLSAARRLGVYVNHARAHFLGSLKSSYPVVLRLVGEDYFRQSVQHFQLQSPSRSGDLLPAGTGFDAFLRQTVDPEYTYLAEVARLEWLVQGAALAADAAPFDMTRLAALPVGQYDALRFRLHPSARLFISTVPCVDIWQANVDLSREPDFIDLDQAPRAVVIARSRGQIRFHPLTVGEVQLLTAFTDDLPFDAAVAAALADPEFDAAAALSRFVRNEIVVGFT